MDEGKRRKKIKHHKKTSQHEWSEEKEVRELREALGLPQVNRKIYECLRCKKEFVGQEKDGQRLLFYCYQCRGVITRNNEVPDW